MKSSARNWGSSDSLPVTSIRKWSGPSFFKKQREGQSLKIDSPVQSSRSMNRRSQNPVNQLQEEQLLQVAAGDAMISVDRICCLRRVRGKTLLVSLPRTSPQKYLLPYRNQLSFEDTFYRVLLSPKSQDRFSFWPFGIFHIRPESVSCRNPRRLPSAILVSESRTGCNADCNWRLRIESSDGKGNDLLCFLLRRKDSSFTG